ncbi:MAG: bifunctional hydroxymethylpyrimidine kinase/phosphomethylpyrimidine kinase [Cetobacterium sp.]|uniref:bifunctional hydroxymethylpyrimidine kinase/phosphomethylpyrimidine kinase n=1 Tax=Cetobacterium sp. TaxID=2071632 RepID=UPI003F2E22BB
MKKILTIAGSDSCGGAGIQADLKAISAQGAYGMSVITAITAQNTQGVFSVEELSKEIIEGQLKAIFDDIKVDGIKVGMLSSKYIIDTVNEQLIKYKGKNIVIDPVMISKSGFNLLRPEAVEALTNLIKIADLVTPNIPEAEVLANMKIETEEDMIEAGKRIKSMGPKNVLIKGGHRMDKPTDILLTEAGEIIKYESKRYETKNTHGTGCTLSSTIASYLGKGYSMEEAVGEGKKYISKAIENSFSIGHGVGPVGHFVELYKKAGVDYE